MRPAGSRAGRAVLLAICLIVLPLALAARPSSQGQRGGAGPADVNGFKIGDTVEVDTAFGWGDAQIVAIAGNNNYRVNVQGIVVMKTYPAELHRKGAFTERDHAVGLYDLKDHVQVNVQGQGWTDGQVITRRGLEYQVQLPGNRTAWASGARIRYVGAPQTAGPKPGTPPKPGFVSCAGKVEGRYASTGGFGSITIVFRSGKATMSSLAGDDEVLECWTSGEKIILRKSDHPEQDMPIDINNDGSLQTPLGELKKKGGSNR